MILNLLDRMKLPFRKNKEFLSALYDILGFYPHDIEVYRVAFSHKSLSFRRDFNPKERKGKERRNRNIDNPTKPLNNERLEYLGDAVLETVVSDILFRHYPTKREGFLTSTRSKIVQRESLNKLATEMGLERLIQAAQGTRMSHTNIGGNAFEALMGAIYLDRGFRFCHWFIANRVIGHYIDLDNVAQKEVNFKSKLLEWSQKNRININFKDVACEGEGKGFKTVITIEGIVAGRGAGRSKKESQQDASKEALTRMRRDAKMYDSLFRAKEKRTAMEAEESFALPKIDVIEQSLTQTTNEKSPKKAPKQEVVLEKKPANYAAIDSDAAYDAAYDENADFEVIDTPPVEPQLTPEDYLSKGLPLPPLENELEEQPVERPKKRKQRTPKTVNDAVKDFAKKGAENEPTANAQTANAPAAHVQAENPVADTNEVAPAEPTAAKEKKNRRKNRKSEETEGSELNREEAMTEATLNEEQSATPLADAADAHSAEPAVMTEDEREMRELEEEIKAEENRRLAFEAKQAAQKARYEAEKARRAERKAMREAAQEPLQTATAVLISEPETAEKPVAEPTEPEVPDAKAEKSKGFIVVKDLEPVEPTEEKPEETEMPSVNNTCETEENVELDLDSAVQSVHAESAVPALDAVDAETSVELDLDSAVQSVHAESAAPTLDAVDAEASVELDLDSAVQSVHAESAAPTLDAVDAEPSVELDLDSAVQSVHAEIAASTLDAADAEPNVELDLDSAVQSVHAEIATPDLDAAETNEADEAEEADEPDAIEEKQAQAAAFSDETPLPQMRHLTLDDFVFGMEHLEQPQISESEAEDEWGDSEEKAKEQARRKRNKSRRSRGNKNKNGQATPTDEVNAKDTPQHEQQPKPQKPKLQNADPNRAAKSANAEAMQSAEVKADPADEAQPVSKRKRRRRRPRKKHTGDAPAESAAQ